jgi:hypothetical protein
MQDIKGAKKSDRFSLCFHLQKQPKQRRGVTVSNQRFYLQSLDTLIRKYGNSHDFYQHTAP